MIYSENQVTGFCIITNAGFNGLTRHLKLSYDVAINIFLNQSNSLVELGLKMGEP